MGRRSKRNIIFVGGLIFTAIYCEFLIYYVVISQCSWPYVISEGGEPLNVLIIADTHLLGPVKGHWFDKLRREWQMHRAFQAIMTVHQPEAVFVLGDLFDEGEWSDAEEFQEYVERFQRLFYVKENVRLHVVAGNHDTGFHNSAGKTTVEMFEKLLKSPPVQLVSIKNNHFVMINSMAMEGDCCSLCTRARDQIENLTTILKCYAKPSSCGIERSNINTYYSPPILLQHFPLYRKSDGICNEPDSPPPHEKNKPFRNKIDALSKEATKFLISRLKPRVVFGGHTHHGCLVEHKETLNKFLEYSVPSFSWRNRRDPKYMLVTITPDTYAVEKCGLPMEATIAATAVIFILLVSYCAIQTTRIYVPSNKNT